MIQLQDYELYRRNRVVLVFRTIIVDKAGGMPWCRPVLAEIVDTDITGTALMLTANRTHLQFPVRELHKPNAAITDVLKTCGSISAALQAFSADEFSYFGGQEVLWDSHKSVTPASFRYLTVDEIIEALADVDALVDAEA